MSKQWVCANAISYIIYVDKLFMSVLHRTAYADNLFNKMRFPTN